MDLAGRITIDPEICHGRPTIRGTRIRAIDILDLLTAGMTAKEILEDFPDLEMDDIQAALSYAARYMNHPRLAA